MYRPQESLKEEADTSKKLCQLPYQESGMFQDLISISNGSQPWEHVYQIQR